MPLLLKYVGYLATLILFGTLTTCRSGTGQRAATPTNALFEQIPATHTGITFENRLAPSDSLNILTYNYFYNGGGVAAADFNRDGRTDLYFTGNQVSGRLYLNNGQFVFRDVTEQAGVGTTDWCTGIAVADVNADSLPDIYICRAGYADAARRANLLFINTGVDSLGVPHFVESAGKVGLADTGYSSQASFFDYDRDGDLDCYVTNHNQDKHNPNYPAPKQTDGQGPAADKLYRNDGGTFTNVSQAAGIRDEGYGLSTRIADINRDGWPDIYVANDFIYDDLLYLNNRSGTFTESLSAVAGHTSRFSMGSDVADYTNDGWPDVVVADMMPEDSYRQKLMNQGMNNDLFNTSLQRGYLPQYSRNTLQINTGMLTNGLPAFREIGQLAGVSQTDWSWSALFADLDNDGWKDLFITNGIPHDITSNDFVAYRDEAVQQQGESPALLKTLLAKVDALPPVDKPNRAFQNRRDLTFAPIEQEWGLDLPGFSNGAALADLDNDGDLDMAINNLEGIPFVLKNRADARLKSKSVRLKLAGQGIGVRVRAVAGPLVQFVENNPQRGFQSTQENIVHLGINQQKQVDTLDVVWPSGRWQRILTIPAGQVRILREAEGISSAIPFAWATAQPPASVLLHDVTTTHQLTFSLVENEFEEFDVEPMLPHRFSRQGPCLAVGDVNGDSRDDFFVGGAAKLAGTLFLQTPAGEFTSRAMADPGFEDTGALFFDADRDGDLDLYVVSGGNEYNPLTAAYQDRLYRNDSRGNFTRDKSAIPREYASGYCVSSADYDRDGDLDLFVGGRVIPTQYPQPAESFLFQNDGKGHFQDVSDQVCPGLKYAGLVTSAVWTDANQDGWPDLMVAGEWMPLRLFQNNRGAFTSTNAFGKTPTAGWWTSLAAADFDQDGDEDIVAGNLGLNSRLKATPNRPLSVFAKDLDQNGSSEYLLTYWPQNQEVAYLNRDGIAGQYPAIKKKFPTHEAYAATSFANLLTPDERAGGLMLTATELQTVYLENQGKGQFKLLPLPLGAQLAPIHSWVIRDLNADGHPDLLAGGNWFDADFGTGRYDAGGIIALLNTGKGRFGAMTPAEVGLQFNTDIRAIKPITISRKPRLLVGSNTAPLRLLGF